MAAWLRIYLHIASINALIYLGWSPGINISKSPFLNCCIVQAIDWKPGVFSLRFIFRSLASILRPKAYLQNSKILKKMWWFVRQLYIIRKIFVGTLLWISTTNIPLMHFIPFNSFLCYLGLIKPLSQTYFTSFLNSLLYTCTEHSSSSSDYLIISFGTE